MDKDEAERLIKIIGKAPKEWLQVRGIEYNPMLSRYEIKCIYRRSKAMTTWKEMWIRSPRELIQLLMYHSDD